MQFLFALQIDARWCAVFDAVHRLKVGGAAQAEQRVFFVATAPLALDGHVNISPKGGDSFRVLGPTEIAYQDYTGSGIETTAHVREYNRGTETRHLRRKGGRSVL